MIGLSHLILGLTLLDRPDIDTSDEPNQPPTIYQILFLIQFGSPVILSLSVLLYRYFRKMNYSGSYSPRLINMRFISFPELPGPDAGKVGLQDLKLVFELLTSRFSS